VAQAVEVGLEMQVDVMVSDAPFADQASAASRAVPRV
jgi:hypothetical protein